MRRQAIARLVVTAVLGGSLLGVGGGMTSAGAAPQAEAACNANTYKPKYRTSRLKVTPVVTQIGARTLPPGGSRKVTTKVSTRTTVRAGARLSSAVSTKVENKLIGSAEVQVGLDLSLSGARTNTERSKVTERVANGTKRNQKYVFFRGTTKVTGKARTSYCNAQDGTGGGTVEWRTGRVTSFTFVDQGVSRCGAGSTGAVSEQALRIGCR